LKFFRGYLMLFSYSTEVQVLFVATKPAIDQSLLLNVYFHDHLLKQVSLLLLIELQNVSIINYNI